MHTNAFFAESLAKVFEMPRIEGDHSDIRDVPLSPARAIRRHGTTYSNAAEELVASLKSAAV
jgi:hypothetical protein